MTWLNKFLYQTDKSCPVFLSFVIADARYVAELLNGGGFLRGKGVQHLVAEDDIGRESLFFSTLAAQLTQGLKQFRVFDTWALPSNCGR